jgi:hypothetical protein
MTDPSARRRLCFDGNSDGFGRLYNAASPSKQAIDPHNYRHKATIFEGISPRPNAPDLPAVTAAPIWGWQSDWLGFHERSGTA